MRAFLADGKTIIWSGLAFVGLTIAFGIWIQRYDLHIIDEISDPDQIRAVVAAMTPEQMSAHWWMTLSLDYFYPLAYGAFFAGLALRYFGAAGLWIIVPSMIVVPADIIENTVQLFILSGDQSLIGVKVFATPIKLVSFIVAGLIALIALIYAVYRRFSADGDD
ncbi:MAG: hypothetical protein K0U61_00135 [Alphaproteobacteria bacterium]|jgi:hypothetical protein|nr:hypothetical protein [Alphaproteobacteria bacterium]